MSKKTSCFTVLVATVVTYLDTLWSSRVLEIYSYYVTYHDAKIKITLST